MAKSALLKSSIAKKKSYGAFRTFFNFIFSTAFFFINMTSVLVRYFNSISHFMEIILYSVCYSANFIGVIFHFHMGFVLILKSCARPIKYIKNNGAASSPWASRNMIVSGSVVLAFWHLHFTIFGFPEMVYKYVDASPLNETRYFHELVEI
jgi:succinate dehydrogenase / fumarate reductase cytochrome b subunit